MDILSGIAAAVAEEMTTPATGIKVRYVVSDEVPCNEVARILGAAIGKPGLQWLTITNEEMLSRLEAAGMAPGTAALFVELNASIHTGELLRDYFIEKPPVTGKIKNDRFCKGICRYIYTKLIPVGLWQTHNYTGLKQLRSFTSTKGFQNRNTR